MILSYYSPLEVFSGNIYFIGFLMEIVSKFDLCELFEPRF
jgi:hypothetical protein